jgi:hypothetical protein
MVVIKRWGENSYGLHLAAPSLVVALGLTPFNLDQIWNRQFGEIVFVARGASTLAGHVTLSSRIGIPDAGQISNSARPRKRGSSD